MDIKYLGHSSFRIRGKRVILVTDPFDAKMVGFRYPSTEADIITVSHEHADHNAISVVKYRDRHAPIIVHGPGEYEISGVKIFGYPTFHDKEEGKVRGKNTIYRIEMDGISMLHCGDLGHLLSSSLLDDIDGIDILMIPTGGYFTINENEATKVVAQIEPKIVIPMHYKTKLHADSYSELSDKSAFLKAMDKSPEPISKLTVSRDKLPLELEVVSLQTS